MSSDSISIPAADQSVLNKSVGNLIGEDVFVSKTGNVSGTLKYVQGFTDFSNIPDEQNGHYMPFELKQKGQKMSIRKNGHTNPAKENMTFDPSIVLRIESTSDTFTILVDGNEVVTLKFTKATLQPQ